MRLTVSLFILLACAPAARAGIYAPPAGQAGSTAIARTDPTIVGWATAFQNLVRGPQDLSAGTGAPFASFGTGLEALGPSQNDALKTVSLGDGGSIVVTFNHPIINGAGADFAVFENGITDAFLELAFVEVSTDGANFVRFPAVSQTPTTTQIGGFSALDATNLNNFAGKYRLGFGTPFDLAELVGNPLLDLNSINYVRLVDVVGSINSALGTLDSLGNLVNDPFTTPFPSSGFDLDAVAVIHAAPEPGTIALALAALAGLLPCYLRRRGGR